MKTGQQRARSDEDKEARAREILDAALSLSREGSFAELNVAQVARRAGIAKGTVYLYFASKEALGIALVDRLLGEWFDEVDSALACTGKGSAAEDVVGLLARSLDGREDLVKLMAILGSILEQNVDRDTAAAFKRSLRDRLLETGARIERALPFLAAGEGARLLLLANALVIGLYQMAGPAPVVQELLESEEFALFRVDFQGALKEALSIHLEGLRSRGVR